LIVIAATVGEVWFVLLAKALESRRKLILNQMHLVSAVVGHSQVIIVHIAEKPYLIQYLAGPCLNLVPLAGVPVKIPIINCTVEAVKKLYSSLSTNRTHTLNCAWVLFQHTVKICT
jgi:hypothetical protein